MAAKPRGTTTHGGDPQPISQDAPREVALVEFSNRLRKAMNDRGLSQSELGRQASEALGREIGRDSVSQYLRAITFPNPEKLQALCTVLKKEPAEILPTRGVTRSTDKIEPIGISQMANGDAWLRINQQVPWEKAIKILAILKDEA